ncbi:hypothetical protein OFN54_31810, partial [Escherichia coli]|nr:hypothetical protein [Escherichia coli]
MLLFYEFVKVNIIDSLPSNSTLSREFGCKRLRESIVIVGRFPPQAKLLFVHWLSEQVSLHEITSISGQPFVHNV